MTGFHRIHTKDYLKARVCIDTILERCSPVNKEISLLEVKPSLVFTSGPFKMYALKESVSV